MIPTRLKAVFVALVASAPAPALAAAPVFDPPVSGGNATASSAGPQVDPAIAVDPADGTHRVLLATEAATQRAGVWRTADGGTTWAFVRDLASPSGVTSAGLSEAAWGAGQRLYATWLGRAAAGTAPDCSTSAGAYLSTSGDGGATWDTSGAAMKVRGGTNGTSGAFLSRSWPVLAVDGSTSATAGQPVVAMERATWHGGACGAGTVDREITLNWRLADGPFTFDYTLPVTDASYPAIVAIPAALPTVAVAYLRQPSGGTATVEVVTCYRNDAEQLIVDYWHCGAPATVSTPTFQAIGGVAWAGHTVAANSAPSLAISPTTSALDVVYAGVAGGDAEVYLSASDPTRNAWTTPVSVVSGPAEAADQLLPSVSAGPGGRADVVYLDRRDGDATNGLYRAYATSFRCPAARTWCSAEELLRGADIPLSPATATPPTVGGVWSLGTRTAAATVTTLPSPYLGHALGYWPLGDEVREGELWHGLRAPLIAPDGPTEPVPTAKNAITPIDALFATFDPDGDPVEVSTTPNDGPAHGTITAMAYAPALSYTGPDTFVVHASDGLNSTPAIHELEVVDQAPTVDPHDPVVVAEGSSADVALTASDPDPGDVVHLSLGYLPATIQPYVSIDGTTLRIAIPAGVRSRTPLTIEVLATDTSIPPENAMSDTVTIGLTITPTVARPTVTATVVAVAGTTVRLSATGSWLDPDHACLYSGGTCSYEYEWTWGDGATEVTPNGDARSHTYAATGTYNPSVRVRVVGYPTTPWSDPVTVSTLPPLTGDARAHLYLHAKQSGRVLRVALRSRDSVQVTVRFRIGPGKWKTKNRTLVAGPAKTWGPAATVSFTLRGKGRRVATVEVSYTGTLAGGPAPGPLQRIVILH